MARIRKGTSRTFMEFLYQPRYSTKKHTPKNVSLRTPVARFKRGEESQLYFNTPTVAAIMQSISGTNMLIGTAREGANAICFSSQPIDSEAEMIRQAKKSRGVFQASEIYFGPNHTLRDVLLFVEETGYSTIPITEDGTKTGKLIGMVTDGNTWRGDSPKTKIRDFMTPFDDTYPRAVKGTTLEKCRQIMKTRSSIALPIKHLPILNPDGTLEFLVFKKDFDERYKYPLEVIDSQGRYVVGAGVNTHDYTERIPELIAAGADYICFDSSNAFTEYMREAIRWAKKKYPGLIVGAGNIVDRDSFNFLARAGADFIKVGIGGGSICITREQKAEGRGQASAVIDVKSAQKAWFKKHNEYVPFWSDGGLAQDNHLVIAFALGADAVMMGRYFAGTDESPTEKRDLNGRLVKPYWGEGSKRARNWQRYVKDTSSFNFEQGVDGYVPCIGPLAPVLDTTMQKLKQAMCDSGALTLEEFTRKAVLAMISPSTLREGKPHDIFQSDSLGIYNQLEWG